MPQDYAKNRQVAEVFYRHARAAVQESALPVLEVHGDRQHGSDFGTRLANAVADAFAEGYERVIAVGSDCPRLHEVDWLDVSERLSEGVPVLGPTPDRDGAYLIGLHRSQFEKTAFSALPWKSANLFSILERHLAACAGTDPALLAARDDVNGHGELVALLRSPECLSEKLVAGLRFVLGPTKHAGRSETMAPGRTLCGRRSRAPPSRRVNRRVSA